MTHDWRPTRILLAFSLFGIAIALVARYNAPWWVIGLGTLGPDLSFLAALGATPPARGVLPPRAVHAYNALHHPLNPGLLALAALLASNTTIAALAIAWAAHIAWDRGLGYRLRAADGTLRPPTSPRPSKRSSHPAT